MTDLIYGIFGLVIGIAFFLSSLWIVKNARAAQTWPRVAGEIISSKVIHHRSGEHTYTASIEYSYSVKGQDYQSEKIILYGSGNPQKMVAKYPVNRAVDVYYNPKNPEQAALEIITREYRFTILICFLVSIIAILYVLSSIFG